MAGPNITTPKEGQQFDIMKEKNISITCTATGYPTPTINWRTNNGIIVGSSNNNRVKSSTPVTSPTIVDNMVNISVTLIMMGATKEDTGIYRCVATNEVSTTVLTINVHCKCLHKSHT